jgi:hypothetical protein
VLSRSRGGHRARPHRRDLRPLHLGLLRPLVTALAAYFDASRNYEGDASKQIETPSIIAVAGYIAPVDLWDKEFTPAWWEALGRANRAAPHPVREFKASNCRQGTGEFKGWSEEARHVLTVDLVSEIVKPAGRLMGLGAAMWFDPKYIASEARARKWRKWRDFSYCWCLAMVALDAMRVAEAHVGEDHLQIVFDEEKDYTGRAQATFETVRSLFEPTFGQRVRPLQFARSHELPPLQAADLLAYETYKELKSRTEAPPRKPSGALRRLVEEQVHVAHYYNAHELARTLSRIRSGEIEMTEDTTFPSIFSSAAADTICREPSD